MSGSGLGSIPELELELEAMELELELHNGIEDVISILLIFPLLSSARMLIMHIDVSKIVKVFSKERICFITSYCKKFSVIEL